MRGIFKIFMSILYLLLSIALMAMCIYVKDYLTINDRNILIILAVLNFLGALVISVIADFSTGAYECKNCGKVFKPSLISYIFATHTPSKRHLRCPECKEKTMCKRLLNEKKEKPKQKKGNK